jgi:hypothetical protein
MKLEYTINTVDNRINYINISISNDEIEYSIYHHINKKSLLISDIENCLEMLNNKESIDKIYTLSYNYDNDSCICCSKKKLTLDNLSVFITDDLRPQIIKMIECIKKMCVYSEYTMFCNKIANYSIDQLPIIQKIDKDYLLFKYNRSREGSQSIVNKELTSKNEVDKMCEFINQYDKFKNGDKFILNNGKLLRISGNNLLIDYGFDDTYFCANIDNEKCRDNLVKELIKFSEEYFK